MDITIQPGTLQGKLTIPSSKSQAHRMLICAAFADAPTEIVCNGTGRDVNATVECLRALHVQIETTQQGYRVIPREKHLPPDGEAAVLDCGESGTTLRFLLPIAGALGQKTIFRMSGRLPQRPLSPLREEMERMGCTFRWDSPTELCLSGQLHSGEYRFRGDVSSQFLSGLLLAMPLMEGKSVLRVIGTLESAPYLAMTREVMTMFGVLAESMEILPDAEYRSPSRLTVEGDWSSGAFFLGADYLGSQVDVYGLNFRSVQGDRRVMELLPELREEACTISAAEIPDLVPILAVVAACNHGATFTQIRRLRLKESDRVASIVAMIRDLGGQAEADEDTLTVKGDALVGGTVDPVGDHRIAMAAGIAATACYLPVTISGGECVQKSYPGFWEELERLGGVCEFSIR